MTVCESEKCFGCGLCVAVCPKNCIKMVTNDEGFLEPICDEEKCINCGLCQKKCPSLNLIKYSKENQKYYLAWLKDDSIRKKSSSGGAFSSFAKPIINSGGAVVGAAYNEKFEVSHIIAKNEAELEALRKSKYLQSDISGIYSEINDCLKENRKVLFSGTPCQCAAVKSFFGDNSNLFLCDLICHGVQSPGVFKDSLKYMEQKAGAICTYIDFRSKKKGWANACTTELHFENGKTVNKRANDVPVGAAFLKNLGIRKTCERCPYRTMERSGDITIGDFWAIRDDRETLKEYGDAGYSSIIENSEKGNELLQMAKEYLMIFEKTEAEIQAQNNPLWKQFKPNPQRDEFFKDYKVMDYNELYNKYLKPDYKKIIRWHILKFGRKTGLLNLYSAVRRKL